jgi:5-(carboxyamino)imidazole ribonucleotide synthase
MFAIAARRMGYRVHTFSPDADTPTGQVADVEIRASYDDLDEVRAFASRVRVLTFEFENVPAAAAAAAAEATLVRPAGSVLHTTQNRLREKTFFARNGFPCAPFRAVRSLDELQAALAELGTPAVLKTAGFGYDGKGQAKIRDRREAEAAFAVLGGQEGILEAFVAFDREVSVVATRGVDGSFAAFDVTENEHRDHILHRSLVPARIPAGAAEEAIAIARRIAEALDYVGTFAVEFFLIDGEGGQVIVNEIAPRVHNSGHWTMDGAFTCQFEQHIRAVAGWPLGDTARLGRVEMVNLIGDEAADWRAILADGRAHLHLYGKRAMRPGRKMGHVNRILGE